MNSALQLLKIYRSFIHFRLRHALQYRFETFARILSDFVWNIVVFLIFQVVFYHTNSIAGWTAPEMKLFLAVAFTISALLSIFMGDTLFRFPEYVNRGDLDSFILRPVPTLFFSTARHIDLSFIASLIFAVLFFIYALSLQTEALPMLNWLCFWGFFFWSGLLSAVLLMLLFIMPSLWTGSDHAFSWLYWPFYEVLVEKPYQIFSPGIKFVLSYVLPFSALISIPATALVQGPSLWLFFNAILVNVALFLLVTFLWKRGLRAYSSASS